MGRTRGFLALNVGLTVGAEMILIPEVKYENEKIFKLLEKLKKEEKSQPSSLQLKESETPVNLQLKSRKPRDQKLDLAF
jgi:6-phosphofructokinase